MKQRGGFAMGLVAGLLVGLALALGVALYITKAPVPFINKVPQRTAEQDNAEAERNKSWDPNAALGAKSAARAASAAAATAAGSAPAAAVPVAAAPAVAAAPPASAPAVKPTPPWRDPGAILSGAQVPDGKSTAPAAEPFVYFVQAGAFTRNEDAEQQRAKLAMGGLQAKITEREQAGRTVYRVRLGPYPGRAGADELQQRLQAEGIEAQIVRVEKQP